MSLSSRPINQTNFLNQWNLLGRGSTDKTNKNPIVGPPTNDQSNQNQNPNAKVSISNSNSPQISFLPQASIASIHTPSNPKPKPLPSNPSNPSKPQPQFIPPKPVPQVSLGNLPSNLQKGIKSSDKNKRKRKSDQSGMGGWMYPFDGCNCC